MTDGSDEDLGRVLVVLVDLDNLSDESHARRRDVIEPSDERADVRGSHLRGDERLRRRENEGHVHALPL
jgi:hypothetical protein